ncbi:unnamed protein product [Lactuca virosa]|uniref:Uncharacterized protein n=1 Tax=Lactuca virosa TaxID=75947 RepID=A0AAU9NSV1_9ASTR|nr:unnamed protein product [Lactuca virosa]
MWELILGNMKSRCSMNLEYSAQYCFPIIVNSFQKAPAIKKKKKYGSEHYPQGNLKLSHTCEVYFLKRKPFFSDMNKKHIEPNILS